MTAWHDTFAKILALGLGTRIEPEQRAALTAAAALAARHRLSLGSAYLRIERSMPDSFRYLEDKRLAAGLPSFVAEGDVALHAEVLDASSGHYAGDRRALEAMLSCTIRPLSCRSRAPKPPNG